MRRNKTIVLGILLVVAFMVFLRQAPQAEQPEHHRAGTFRGINGVGGAAAAGGRSQQRPWEARAAKARMHLDDNINDQQLPQPNMAARQRDTLGGRPHAAAADSNGGLQNRADNAVPEVGRADGGENALKGNDDTNMFAQLRRQRQQEQPNKQHRAPKPQQLGGEQQAMMDQQRQQRKRSHEQVVHQQQRHLQQQDPANLPVVYVKPAAEPINVLISSDSATMMGVPSLINSILKNTKQPDVVVFYVMVDSAAEELRLYRWLMLAFGEKVMSQIVLKVFPVEWVTNKIKIRGRRKDLASPANYARYYVLDLFPEMTGRIVYLDSDVIVRGDIAELYNHPIHEGHIAVFVQDCERNRFKSFVNLQHPKVQALKIDPDTCSFNAGVYVADLQRWREQNITKELEYWMELNTRENVYGGQGSGGGSQPPMLLVFLGRRSNLDPLWHVRHLGWHGSDKYTQEFVESAKILHWNGAGKPWLKTGGANFPNLWRQYCIPEAILAPNACSRQLTADNPLVYHSDQVLDPFDCATLREAREQELAAGIALNCRFD